MTYQTPEESARDLMSYMKSMDGQQHVFREVDSKDFRNVNQKFYRLSQSALEALGFRYLTDVEDVTITAIENATNKKPKLKRLSTASLSSWWSFLSQPIIFIPKCNTATFVRVMVNDDHTTIAGICHLPTSSWWARFLQFLRLRPQDWLTVEFETEFSNGTFLITSNTKEILELTRETPGIHRQLLPAKADIQQSLTQHNQTLQHMLSGDIEVKLVNSWPEAEAMQHRGQAIKKSYRESIGYITGEDIERLSNGRYDKAAKLIGDEIEKLRREEETDSRS